MQIISHRGYWLSPSEKNSMDAFKRSLDLGFGFETDIRDFGGDLVVSHDMPGPANIHLTTLLDLYMNYPQVPLALNIKSDGLQTHLAKIITQYNLQNFFVFDMSIPDTLGYLKAGICFYSRQSEYELTPSLYDQADGVWLDGFSDEWFTEDIINNHLRQGKKVCIVSPELHGRDHSSFWRSLMQYSCLSDPSLMLCTDLPEEARSLFHGKN